MGSKLNIAIFHLGFFFSGGGEKLVLEEAIYLKKKGHKVDLYAPVVDTKRCFPDIIKKIKVNKLFPSIPVFALRDFIAIVGSIILTPILFLRFRKYDLFFGANQPGPLICFLLSNILKTPYVIYLAQPTRIIHPRLVDRQLGFGKGSFDLFFYFARVFYPLVKYLDDVSIKGATKVLTNGKYIGKVIERTYKVRTTSVPAGCYPKRFKANRFKGNILIKGIVISKPYLLITNRHFPQKRFDFLITIFPEIIKKSPNISLVITGAFTWHTLKLKSLVRDLKLGHKVKFTGLVTENELINLYKNSSVYVYTAPQEDFGMGVVEAMGYGIPVVAWKAGGPQTTIVNGETGFLIKPYNLNLFKTGILKLVTDKRLNLNMGRNAYNHSKKYSYLNHNKKLEQELQNVVHIM